MAWRWYSYPSLLRKPSTSSLDCLESFACAGVMVGGDFSYNPSGPGAFFDWTVQYAFIPLANADGVVIRGDSCDGQTGEFDNRYTGASMPGRFYLLLHGISDSVPFKYAKTSEVTKGFGSADCSSGIRWTYSGNFPDGYGGSNSGRFSFDFDSMTATVDARIDAEVWNCFLSPNNAGGNYDANMPVNRFAQIYPNQSVDLSNLDVGGRPGLVFTKTLQGSKNSYQTLSAAEFFDVYDENQNLRWWKFDPINDPYFVIPFRRSNS